MLIYALVAGSLATAVISGYLYLKKDKYALALALPVVTMTFITGVLMNVLVFETAPRDGMKIPMYVAGALLVVTYFAAGILTPLLTWFLLTGLVAAPLVALGEIAVGGTAESEFPLAVGIVVLVAGGFLTWLLLPALKTLLVSLLVSTNAGFGVSLLFVSSSSILEIGFAVSVVSFVAVVFIAREKWSQTWSAVMNRFKKSEA